MLKKLAFYIHLRSTYGCILITSTLRGNCMVFYIPFHWIISQVLLYTQIIGVASDDSLGFKISNCNTIILTILYSIFTLHPAMSVDSPETLGKSYTTFTSVAYCQHISGFLFSHSVHSTNLFSSAVSNLKGSYLQVNLLLFLQNIMHVIIFILCGC